MIPRTPGDGAGAHRRPDDEPEPITSGDIGKPKHEEPAELALEHNAETEAVQAAIEREFGQPTKKHLGVEVQTHEPRARITGFGRTLSYPGIDEQVATSVNTIHGTMVLAHGKGTSVGVEAMAAGFDHAMQARRVASRTIDAALGEIDRVIDKRIPSIFAAAQTHLGVNAGESYGEGLAVQIVDNRLAFRGSGAIFAYNPMTGEGKWLSRGPDIPRGTDVLDAGNHVLIMTAGHESADAMPNTLAMSTSIREALESFPLPHTDSDPSSQPTNNQFADEISKRVAHDLHATGARNTVMAAIIEVRPWEDDRRPIVQKLDRVLRIPSTAVTSLMAYAGHKRGDARTRRELYETNTTAGRIGRAGAVLTDMAFDAGVLLLATIGIRSALTAGNIATDMLDHSGLGNLTPTPHGSPSGTVHPSPEVTPTPSHTTAPGNTGGVPPSGNSTQPPEVPNNPAEPRPGTPPEPEPVPATITALRHDPNNHGQATSVTSINRELADYYGHKHGLSQTQIDAIKANWPFIDKANQVFMHDTHDADNIATLHHPKNWVINHTTYSTIDAANYMDHAMAAKAEELHVTPSTDDPITPEPPVTPPSTEQPGGGTASGVDLQPVGVGRAQESRGFDPVILEIVGAALAASALIAGAGALHNRRRRKRHEREPEIKTFSGSRAEPVEHKAKNPRLTLAPTALTANPRRVEEIIPGFVPMGRVAALRDYVTMVRRERVLAASRDQAEGD